MTSLDEARETQLTNIKAKTGKTLDQLYTLIRKSGLAKHSEIREMLKWNLGLGYGDANMLALFYFKSDQALAGQSKPAAGNDAINEIYCLRRKRQFAMIGPATQTRIGVGLNMKRIKPTARLIAMPAGGMCQYKVNVTNVKEVDKELMAWIRQAYDSGG